MIDLDLQGHLGLKLINAPQMTLSTQYHVTDLTFYHKICSKMHAWKVSVGIEYYGFD